jgi:hypothetical protein
LIELVQNEAYAPIQVRAAGSVKAVPDLPPEAKFTASSDVYAAVDEEPVIFPESEHGEAGEIGGSDTDELH